MNVKYIFLCTVFVVLPNGLYSDDQKTPKSTTMYPLLKPEVWLKESNKKCPMQSDDDDNVKLYIVTWHGHKRTYIFVQSPSKIGMNVKAPFGESTNREVIRYLAEILDVPKSIITIIDGKTSRMKTVRVGGGYRSYERIVAKIMRRVKLERRNLNIGPEYDSDELYSTF